MIQHNGFLSTFSQTFTSGCVFALKMVQIMEGCYIVRWCQILTSHANHTTRLPLIPMLRDELWCDRKLHIRSMGQWLVNVLSCLNYATMQMVWSKSMTQWDMSVR